MNAFTIEDVYKAGDQWYRIAVDIFPWSHYYTFDYSTWTLRKAWMKAPDVAMDVVEHLGR